MDKATLDKLVKMMSSENDSDAVMGLRGMQGLLRVEGIDFATALEFIIAHKEMFAEKTPAAIEAGAPAEKAKLPAVEISGMPQCLSPRAGHVEIVVPGQTRGEVVALPGAAAPACAEIAAALKDALVAAAINKSRFKLKLQDVKNERGEIRETMLQAEYERQGMVPVMIWSNVRGEVAALATVLRRAISASMPELAA